MDKEDPIGARAAWRFSCNDPRGWRQRAGQLLARLAGRIDGRIYLVVDVKSNPQLPAREVAQCLRAGLHHGNELIGDSTRNACLETLLRQARPDLYKQEETR